MSSMTETCRLALTPGEPAGIGPDLCIAAAQQAQAEELIAVCDPELLTERAARLRLPLALEPFDPERPPTPSVPGRLLFDAAATLAAPAQAGELNPANAAYVLNTLRAACDGCLNGRWDAMVTGPVHKGVINDAGLAFSGHTEFLAERCRRDGEPTPTPLMLLATPGLRVALATTHLPLAEVPKAITEPLLERIIRIMVNGLRERLGIPHPRILICGLNPHAGEGGHLGHEEQAVLIPVISRLQAEGMDLQGPLPADTVFVPHRLQQADAVLAMYHDQGLPVLKHLGFGQAVNVTLGLPIIRTSVDHGTALDIAGTGRANLGSLTAAIALAAEMVQTTR
ncbi:4-hydroxythreonine-4-phosphate dehydrogenase PdxA [Lamprobacter modestohalophilus]|uniref:4-hydroxythreonine-4-phosphate dehydrogenase n=1 Tax=Lamprobacter modestohalophilus TaxID=1064514 RepID=A0A9X0WC71_9GAMM|nr:4-hydroxythreonine-4-phosphate dehydrogenase PdxA [Lamprobacter modestohalophilus]MBK1620769.1 4-hydroxythreonine-4-phosphate dehydrogenase PdxA [Lamprobacter modestohalophilus]